MSIEMPINKAFALTLGVENERMAAELKRLEARIAELDKENSELAGGMGELALKCSSLRARIALLESALQLPEGCDVFELQRAMKEGAMDAKGRKWRYDNQELAGDYRFSSERPLERIWFKPNGISLEAYGNPAIRLYCIKEANK